MTLAEIYEAMKQKPKPLTPATAFIKELVRITGKSDVTVRAWVYGHQQPDKLCRKAIAEHLKISEKELFKNEES